MAPPSFNVVTTPNNHLAVNTRYFKPLARLVFLELMVTSLMFRLSAQTVTSIVPDGRPHQFAARDHQFFIDGQPTMLVAGEMHFGRVLPQDWETRLQQARAMGLNTVSFYLFWNQVETREGKFNFTGMTDVRRVLSPGGLCVGHAPNAGGIFGSMIRYGDLTHEQAFTPSSIRQMFRSLGYAEAESFEDKPEVHGLMSALRRAI